MVVMSVVLFIMMSLGVGSVGTTVVDVDNGIVGD